MKTKLSGFAIATASAILLACAPATAQNAKVIQAGLQEDEGGQARIDKSGKLRMLSQRIPSAVCHLNRGIATEVAGKVLAGAAKEFDQIINALEFGDSNLGINGAEKDRKVLAKIHDLRAKWEPMNQAAQTLLSGTATEADVNYVLENNMNVLGAAKALVIEVVAEYAIPTEMKQSSSMSIDIAGRQRMLTQKMSKESCILAGDHDNAETLSALQGTMKVFDTSLVALINGMQAAGIAPPPTAAVSEGLSVVLGNWNESKPYLEDIANGASLDAAAEGRKFEILNTTMVNMNKVVGMYAKASADLF